MNKYLPISEAEDVAVSLYWAIAHADFRAVSGTHPGRETARDLMDALSEAKRLERPGVVVSIRPVDEGGE